jgi:hypothetical protein
MERQRNMEALMAQREEKEKKVATHGQRASRSSVDSPVSNSKGPGSNGTAMERGVGNAPRMITTYHSIDSSDGKLTNDRSEYLTFLSPDASLSRTVRIFVDEGRPLSIGRPDAADAGYPQDLELEGVGISSMVCVVHTAADAANIVNKYDPANAFVVTVRSHRPSWGWTVFCAIHARVVSLSTPSFGTRRLLRSLRWSSSTARSEGSSKRRQLR